MALVRSRRASPSRTTRGGVVAGLRRRTTVLAAVLAAPWIVLAANATLFAGTLLRFGIVPRTMTGLPGIVVAPLLHANAAHLLANSYGIVVLGGLVLLRRERDFVVVTLSGTLLGGFATWLVGRPAVHVGASGVVFAYLGYLLSTGLFERRVGAIVLSLAAAVTWGGLLVGLLPLLPGVSWEGHIAGLAAGVLAARALARRR
jgi:membrane associated rhomboid family serine protease